MYDYHQLDIWRRSHALAIEIHLTLRGRARLGPTGLSSQLSRASISVPSNIAEAAGQSTAAQSARFMDIAIGSLMETESHLSLAVATGMLPPESAAKFVNELIQIRRMSFSFKKWLLRRSHS